MIAHCLRVVAADLLHDFQRALHHAAHSRFADEHVMRFFREHEAAGACQRIETGLGQALQLEFAVAIREVREHEERQPVADRFVESAEDARLVDVARMARQQSFGFLAAIAAEVGVQQIDHCPEMPAFLDVDLKQVTQVVQRRTGETEPVLLLHRCGFGVALRDDDAAELRTQFTRDLLPDGFAEVISEADGALRRPVREKNSPAIIRHLHRAVTCPALRVYTDRRAQVDIRRSGIVWTHLPPPVEESRLPVFERALQRAVVRQVDVVRNLGGVVNCHDGLHVCAYQGPLRGEGRRVKA